GGDGITKTTNVSNAMSAGKQAAQNIDRRLMPIAASEKSRWDQIFPDFEFSRQALGEPSLSHRHVARTLPAGVRSRSQQEVVAGLSAQEALEECRRCLRCDLRLPGTTH